MTVLRLAAALACLAHAAAAQRERASNSSAGRIVTDTLWSQSLGARKPLVVYLPPSYARDRARRFPVAYYLHGLAGAERNWTELGHLAEAMDTLVAAGGPEMIVVMPDGDDSWYTTFNVLLDAAGCRRNVPRWVRDTAAYCVPWQHYDDYIARDIVQFVDRKYRTHADRPHRAIAGLSMGGYGAVMLALEYPDVFSAAASHSGVLTPLQFAPTSFATPLPVPDSTVRSMRTFVVPSMRFAFGADTAGWYARDPVHVIDRRRARSVPMPALFADCGTEDPLLAQNRAFRDAMAARGVALVYHEWAGKHDFAYWSAHVKESLGWIADRIAR